jgi:gliding motility-associated-like protein
MKLLHLKILLSITLLLFDFSELRAQITINNTLYTPTQLIDGVLIPSGSGVVVSNVTFSGVYNSSNKYQLGYFTNATTTLSQMGFASGLVLTTGNTSDIPLTLGADPQAVAQMSTSYGSCTTGEIRETGTCPTIINDLNVLAGASNYFNGAILEFDFVPVGTEVKFRYIFGSEEFEDNSGLINYQCSSFNDKFAFLISGPGITGGEGYSSDARNIARLANGSPVSINGVNNGVVGSSGGAPSASNCQAANPSWIENSPVSEYLGPIDGTELNGNTKILTAQQTGLTAGAQYHMKLIITDVNDAAYDAVVYLEANSLTTTSCSIPQPTISPVTQPTCTSSTGSFSITNYNMAYTYAVSPSTGVTVSGNTITAPQGTYTVTASNGTCTSSASLSATVNAAPTVPAIPLIGSIVQPSCTVTTGSFTITNYSGSLTYTSSPSTGVTFSTNTVTASAGTYTITASNGICSATSAQVVINAFTGSLSAPIIDAVNQPTCTTSTGSVDFSGLPSGNWTLTINPGGTTVTGSGTTTSVSSLAAATTYTFSVEDASGCVSSASAGAVVNAQPVTPTAPTIGTITQPNCAVQTGSVALSGLPSSGTWTLTATPGATTQTGSGTSATYSGLNPGTTYTFTVTNAAGCVSPPSGNVVVDALPSGPAAPTASVTVQPTCTLPTGTILVTSPTGASYTYSVNGTTYQVSATFGSLAPGSYNVTVQDVSTSCVSASTVLIVDPLPAGPGAPVANITSQPTCLDPFGAIQITSPTGSGYQFSVNGTAVPIGTFNLTGLDPSQTYSITVTDQSTGCTSSSFDVTIDPVPSGPPVDAGVDVYIEAGDTVILTAIGSGTMVWDNGDITSTIVNPLVTTTYNVTLTDVNGCSSTDQVTVIVQVECGEVFIPTAFSPNGDALNSFFRIKVKQECIVEMNLKVFDRWGEVVFEGMKAEDYWDGTFKGKPLDSAVFVYTLDILLSNSDERQGFSGNLTLIR